MGKHILQLGPVPPPEGGISRNVLAIREELRLRGHRCTIIATSRSVDPPVEEDVYHPSSAAKFARLLAGRRFDLIHAHVGGDVNKRTLAIALAATVFAGKRSVFTLHSGGFPSTAAAKNASRFSPTGIVFRRFGAVISLNDELTDTFKRFGVDEDRIHNILPFSVGLPDPSVAIPEQIAKFVAAHDPLILSVGGLEKEYDPLFQIAAMRRIVEEFPGAGLLIAGDGSMRDELERAVQAAAHADSIFLAGNVPHAVTLHLIAKAAAVLRTTLFDGDAICVREALHLGTPVIATDNGMRPEGTLLIRIGDEEGLLRRLRGLETGQIDPPRSGRQDQSNISAIVEVYNELLNGKR